MKNVIGNDPAGIVDLAELDALANTDSAATTSPICASILVSIISIEATATVFTFAVCK